jgi:hypothetical protein
MSSAHASPAPSISSSRTRPTASAGHLRWEDPDPISKKETRAFAYFMRRSLDLLVPGGIGVFLIPAGMMSGKMSRALRERLLLRNHLLGAYRLPSQDPQGRDNVPGASVVMDLVMLRSRGGELRESDPPTARSSQATILKNTPATSSAKRAALSAVKPPAAARGVTRSRATSRACPP